MLFGCFLFKAPYSAKSASSFSKWHNEKPNPHSALTAVLYHIFIIDQTALHLKMHSKIRNHHLHVSPGI